MCLSIKLYCVEIVEKEYAKYLFIYLIENELGRNTYTQEKITKDKAA